MRSFKEFVASRKKSDDLWNEVAYLQEDYDSQDELFSNSGYVYDLGSDWTKFCIMVGEANGKTVYMAYDYVDPIGEFAWDSLDEAERQAYAFQYAETTGEEWEGDQ